MFKSLQICGTSGSGKTTIVRAVMEDCGAEPIEWITYQKRDSKVAGWDANKNGVGKPLIYAGDHPDGYRLYFLGSYETVCGGCDTINGVGIVADVLQYLHDEEASGICIFEGLMHSHMVGTIGAKQKELGSENHQRAFLDTPLDVCLARVIQRRRDRGQSKPFNPANTQKDWPRVQQCQFNCDKQGMVTHTIFYEDAIEGVYQVIQEMINDRNN
ncbi:hypothetical protein DRQ25_14520 [Candidatus Fermentibacteria bacterium]|nr:MAG: hypothetical protein DRQ25_14520 [Candidatus Fermentibacteria bacterium]